MKRVSTIVFLVGVLGLQACSFRGSVLELEQAEFLECFRLDREPVEDETAVRCTTVSQNQKAGTYHRDPSRELHTDILPISMSPERAARLPNSSCLWIGSSAAGAGEEIAPQWEGTRVATNLQSSSVAGALWHHSACRWDELYPRLSLATPEQRASKPCLGGGVNAQVLWLRNQPLSVIKSRCDILDADYPVIELVASGLSPDGYGICAPHNLTNTRVPGFPYPAGLCTQVEDVGNNTVRFTKTLAPQEDAQYTVKGAFDHPLLPRIRTVVDQRMIARQLQVNAPEAAWSASVLVDRSRVTADPGDRKRLWLENFTDFIRVRRVRVFSVTDKWTDDRQYVSLEGAELTVEDSDDNSGAPSQCSGNGDEFDVVACQIDVTPTYRPANLSRPGLEQLTTPLTWRIVSDEIVANGRHYFVEFELVSTFRTRNATLQADVPVIDFGNANQNDYATNRVKVTNVGSGPFVINGVSIDPRYGQPVAFSASLIDDPIEMPHPLTAEPTGNPNEEEYRIAEWAEEHPMIVVQEFENHVQISEPLLDGADAELLGVSVRFVGNTPVLLSTDPDLSLTMPPEGKTYPLTFPVYREWRLPFTLAPGESRTIQVMGRPYQPGTLKGRLTVSGYPFHAPAAPQDIHVELQVTGTIGPRSEHLPARLEFPRGTYAVDTLNAIIASVGDTDISIGHSLISDDQSGLHAGEAQYFTIVNAPSNGSQITPGDSGLVTVQYDPGCFYQIPNGGKHIALLSVETDIGAHEIPLYGDPVRWAATKPACQPGQ